MLLDDCLSAVDAHVARHIAGRCLNGYLRREEGRTVVMASHQLVALAAADRVVLLAEGRVAFQGTPAEADAVESGRQGRRSSALPLQPPTARGGADGGSGSSGTQRT